jgi:sugar porter (SP) family MFS transporter
VGGANDWRWMLAVMAIPSLIYSLMVLAVPESPRWLIAKQNDIDGAKIVMTKLGVPNVDAEIKSIVASNDHEKKIGGSSSIFSSKYKRIVWLAFLMAFFNQASGINFILYYAPEILERAGLAAKESLFNSIAIGGTNLVFTFVGLYLIDRIGRKLLMLVGSFGYIASLSLVAWCFYAHASAGILLASLLLFIASHAISQGAVIWVFISEIFPNNVRAIGQSFGASIHWVFAALITLVTPYFLDAQEGIFKDNPWPIFGFFAFMMLLQLIWVITKMPETKGVSLEELEKRLVRQ